MIAEIKCLWWSDTVQIGITGDRKVYCLVDGKPIELKSEFHMNRPHYRIPKTSKRYSDLMLNKMCKRKDKIVQHYIPF
jgi:Sec7-like guanine-nucleotide exchange factor